MIISASRRTDIPAFYSAWFYNRIKAGEVYVRNPFYHKKISTVSLRREHVDFIHFWTKNPAPMLRRLNELEGYDYAFHFTVNGYGKSLEPNVPGLPRVMDTFGKLAEKCPVAWRYSPIVISDQFGAEEHIRNFEHIASRLKDHTKRCYISLLDEYPKIKSVIAKHGIRTPTHQEKGSILASITSIAETNGITLYSCADEAWQAAFGIIAGQCLDPAFLGRDGKRYKKDSNQRKDCLCSRSVDIGGYSSCPHDCVYCYANRTAGTPASEHARHNPHSPLITGEPQPGDIITEHSLSCRTRRHCEKKTPTLFDPA